jgi:apolipoprotein D and lipocalin family protein
MNTILTFLMLPPLLALAQAPAPLQTVPKVDLNRYLGVWYEIATIPQRFQKGCTGVTAVYSLRPDGKIDVLNQCHQDSLNGKFKQAHGKAWVVDKQTNAKLKVQFFWPFSGDYWIIELDSAGYQYAVVGHPARKYLWILSRTPQMDEALYQELIIRLRDTHGYDVMRLNRTRQRGDQ